MKSFFIAKEKIFFIFLNLVLCSNIILISQFHMAVSDFTGDDAILWLFFFVAFVLILNPIFKISIFPILDNLYKSKGFIRNFFDKIKYKKHYNIKVLMIAFVLDLLLPFLIYLHSYFVANNNDILPISQMFIIFGGGVFISYFALIIWFKIKELFKKATSE